MTIALEASKIFLIKKAFRALHVQWSSNLLTFQNCVYAHDTDVLMHGTWL